MAAQAEFDPRNRELCPDGACIGLIGPEGRCKECGTISPSTTVHPRHQGMRSEEEVEEELENELEHERAQDSLEPAPDDFDDRLLCADDGCIGVVGADGTCRECGAVADP